MRIKALGIIAGAPVAAAAGLEGAADNNDNPAVRGYLGLRGADHFALYFRFDYVMLNIGR